VGGGPAAKHQFWERCHTHFVPALRDGFGKLRQQGMLHPVKGGLCMVGNAPSLGRFDL
jgi:hypothetical protein